MSRANGDRSLFDRLEPPAGGVEALRLRLSTERTRRTRRRQIGAVGAAMVVAGFILSALTLPSLRGELAAASPLDFSLARMRMGRVPAPANPVNIPADARTDTAALRVLVKDDRVVFYLVATRAAPSPDPKEGSDAADMDGT